MKTRFGPFTIDPETRQLLGQGGDVHLSTKAFDLLCALIERRPKVIEKAELQRRLWPDTHVLSAGLNVLIGEIRRAIADDTQHPRYIRTVHRVGYAFCGAAVDVGPGTQAAPAMVCWLVWKERTFSLSEGDNTIGRDPRCSVWIDEAGVSRRHATIRIDGASRRVALGDLGSTNGTFVRRARIQGEVALNDRDRIRVGTVDLTVRLWAEEKERATRRIPRKPR